MLTSSFHSLSEPGIRDRWEALAAISSIRTPFSELSYVERLAEVTRRRLWIQFIEDDIDVAAVALTGLRIGFWTQFGPGPLTPFSCLIARSLPTEQEVHSGTGWDTCIARDLAKQFDSVILPLPVPVQDVRSFQWNGWDVSPRYTFSLDIGPDLDTIASWSESTRRNFRQHAAGYRLEETRTAARRIVELWNHSYSRHGRQTPITVDQATTLIDSLAPESIRMYTLVRTDDPEPCAGLALLVEGTEAFYWVAGAEPGPSMTVLIGKILPVLGHDGISILDFVGANTPSIAEFKRRFSPRLVPYYVATHSSSLFLRMASGLNQVRRRVFR